MNRILAIHGVAPDVDPRRFEFKNMSDLSMVRNFLASRPPLVPLRETLVGGGMALTVDDSTRGAADATLLAREFGHAVTLFINPEAIDTGAPYWFTLLDLLISKLRRPAYELDGATVPTATVADKLALRRRLLMKGRALRDETSRVAFVLGLVDRWETAEIVIPPYLAPLTMSDLVALRDAGVDIQNHGWSHVDHAILTGPESAREIREGRDWFRRNLAIEAPYFAVPFGNTMPQAEAAAACEAWLTMYWRWPEGPLASRVFNRADPMLRPPLEQPLSSAKLPASAARKLFRRIRRRLFGR
jgi:hypothetical protein